jgi:hypothetical protein
MTIRIANASGFYGDRPEAFRELLETADVDVITGDYLAELTMLILARDKAKDPARGYARTFVAQFQDCMELVAGKGVRLVVNAGGLNPAGLAARLSELSDLSIAYVEGDDLTHRAAELGLGEPLAANAYLGAFGIAECLNNQADVVVTGRVTDASLVVGPAAAHYGWSPRDLDKIAGAMAAGHVIECGTQATGGNYAFFRSIENLDHPGFPIAEIEPDGSSVITKPEGTGGAVTTGTVTAQLLYEVTGARYAGLGPARARRQRPSQDQQCPRRATAGHAQGRDQRARRLPQRGHVRAHRPGHRGQGRSGPAPAARRSDLDAGPHRPPGRRQRRDRQRPAALRRPR